MSESEQSGAARQPAEQPSPASEPPAASAVAVPTGNDGPIGKSRGVLFVILITIVTLGIYHLYWVYKVFDEMKQHTGEGIGGVLGLVIAIVISPVNYFVMPSEVGKMHRKDRQSAPMSGWLGLWLLLPIVGWFVWVVKVQRALNRYWESRAATAAAT